MTLSRCFAYLYALSLASLSASCSLEATSKLDDVDDTIDETIDKIPDVDLDVKVCGDQTLSDLFKGDSISDECRDKVESFLPEPQSSFESRIVVLGQEEHEGGSRTIYVIGADSEGNALFAGAPADVKVSWDIGPQGPPVPLLEGEFTVELELPDDLLSLAIVNDYSASMRDADLADVSEIETDLISVLPPVHEAEVTQFSDMVTLVQPFSEDKDMLLAAVDIDRDYERGSTALYDGMGAGLASLATRERPLRVLLVSTDGAENASTRVTEQELLATATREHVCVIMLGALFADVPTLKRLAGGACGVFFYARGYGRLKSAVEGLVDSLGQVVAIHLPPQPADTVGVIVEANGQKGSYDFGPF